jgi:hypothetical protein
MRVVIEMRGKTPRWRFGFVFILTGCASEVLLIAIFLAPDPLPEDSVEGTTNWRLHPCGSHSMQIGFDQRKWRRDNTPVETRCVSGPATMHLSAP